MYAECAYQGCTQLPVAAGDDIRPPEQHPSTNPILASAFQLTARRDRTSLYPTHIDGVQALLCDLKRGVWYEEVSLAALPSA